MDIRRDGVQVGLLHCVLRQTAPVSSGRSPEHDVPRVTFGPPAASYVWTSIAIGSAEAGTGQFCTGGLRRDGAPAPEGGIGNEYDVNVGVRRQ